MATRTGSWGANATEKRFGTPVSIGVTLDSQEYPNGSISLNLENSAQPKAWQRSGGSSIEFFLCDSAGNNTIKLFDVTGFSQQYTFKFEPKSTTINNTAKTLKGSALYVKSTGDTAGIGTYGLITMTINTANAATAVTKGNKILATDRSQIGTTTTAGEVMTDSHFARGTLIEASTFNSQVLGL